MKKLLSILKATMQGDMNIFKVNLKNNDNSKNKKFKNGLIVLFLLIVLLYSSGTYAYMMAEPLAPFKLTYVMLSIFFIVASVMVLFEGVYKSQGILFDAKDNDFLLSMPIKKSTILTARLIKLISFQYIFDFIFAVPAFAVYAYFEKPGINFYILSIIMIILIPIIPTIVASIIGYIIKMFSSIFKKGKFVQTVLSLALALGIMALSFNMQSLIDDLVKNATSINDMLSKVYYPVGLFTKALQTFEIKYILQLLLINVVPLIAFIIIFSTVYTKILSKSMENYTKSNFKFKQGTLRKSSKIKALLVKEIKRYFSSPIYVINTIFGIILLIIMVVGVAFNFDKTIEIITKGQEIEIDYNMIKSTFSKIYIISLLLLVPTVAITASSISLEGKGIYLTKSLPIKTKQIFMAKILCSNILTIIPIIALSIFAIIRFNFDIESSIQVLLISLIIPTFHAIFGLIINLKFPILDGKNEAIIVKQSTSAMISIFGGAIISVLPAIVYMAAELKMDINLYTNICIVVYAVLTVILWKILNTYGKKKFYEYKW